MLFGFGYNGQQQISTISEANDSDAEDIIIAKPLKLVPKPQSANYGMVTNCELTHVSVSWDSILFIFENGQCCLTGSQSKKNLLTAVGDISVKSGAIKWDSLVILTNHGVCYTVTEYPEPQAQVVTSGEYSTCLISVSCREKSCFALTGGQSVVSLEREEDCVIMKPLSLSVMIKEISCGKEHTLMLSRIGVVFTCGIGGQGQLGHGDVESRSDPTCVAALQCVSVVSVAAGGWHSAALSDLGDLYIWGWNETGQLGFTSKLTQTERQAVCDNIKHEDYVNILPEPRIIDLESCSEVIVSKVSCGSRHTAAVTAMVKYVALVTGSTSGIGLAIARGLASRGDDVILTGLGDDDVIKSLIEDFSSKYKGKTRYIFADLTKSADIEKMCKEIKEFYPDGVDILINNAGFQHVSPIEDFSTEKWDGMIAVMLSAPFHFSKYLLPDMKKKGWGRIINISSAHGLVASPNKAAYVTCKHGILGLTKVVALETAGSGVTCNAICPGYVKTPILQGQVTTLAEKEGFSYKEAEEIFISKFHPSKQVIEVDHLAETVLFLCSDAASQITGSPIIMDGGWTAR